MPCEAIAPAVVANMAAVVEARTNLVTGLEDLLREWQQDTANAITGVAYDHFFLCTSYDELFKP